MSGAGDVVIVEGGWRSTSLRERDCLAREEPRRREECRSTRALSLRVTFLLQGGKVREDGGRIRKRFWKELGQKDEEEKNAMHYG